jgi:hypothetical protein
LDHLEEFKSESLYALCLEYQSIRAALIRQACVYENVAIQELFCDPSYSDCFRRGYEKDNLVVNVGLQRHLITTITGFDSQTSFGI